MFLGTEYASLQRHLVKRSQIPLNTPHAQDRSATAQDRQSHTLHILCYAESASEDGYVAEHRCQ